MAHAPSKRSAISFALLPALAALAFAASCSSKKADAPASRRCELDLSPYRGAGGGALARRIADAKDLLQGDSASGRVGDYLLANDLIRVIIQGPDRHLGPNPFGGAIIDADVVRPDGEPSSDQFGKVAPFYNFGRTTHVERVEVLDGGGKGAAIVAATGHDELNDYLNVKSILPVATSVQADTPVPMLETTYYVLRPGERAVHLVTTFCNDAGKPVQLAVGDLLDSGGDVEFFNPRSRTGGFGYVGGLDGISDVPFYAFWGARSAYGYVPPNATGNSQVTVSGVVGLLVGSSLDQWLGAGNPGAGLTVPARGQARFERDFVVGHDLAEVTGTLYAMRGATVQLSGRVTLSTGAPAAGARVVVRDRGALGVGPFPATVAQTAADGTWSARVPPGAYDVAADLRWIARTTFTPVSASADAAVELPALPAPSTVTVRLRDPAGAPIPGKVVVLCVDAAGKEADCPFPRGEAGAPGALFRSAAMDPWGPRVQAVAFVDQTGATTIELPATGRYAFLASHGPEWSVYPDAWPASLGTPLTAAEAAARPLELELAHVVDTAGWISGDFHVHGVNSPDSSVALMDRLQTFLAEGVDVLVATDHDFVTDYGPTLAELDARTPPGGKKASAWLRTVVGEELTTFDYGHWNAFPLTRDEGDLTGGAVDWAGGTGPSLSPREIHDALRAIPGASPAERVIQANHPRGSLGWFSHVRLDTGDGRTHACPQQFRILGPAGCDPATGSADDTGLFDEGFTAMEIVNDFEEQRIHGRMNDWFTFLSRGLVVTATSVSDTHQRVLVSAGYGRSFVQVANDDPAALDPLVLSRAVNAHHVVASLGAFATLTAASGAAIAGVGDVLPRGAGNVTFHAHVEAPRWLPPWQLELHAYTPGRATRYDANGTGQDDLGNTSWPGYCAAPGPSCNVPAADETAALAAAGVRWTRTGALLAPGNSAAGAQGHQRWVWDWDVTVPVPADHDGWYVLVVRRDPATMGDDLAPAVDAKNGGGTNALTLLAVTNPIFVDANGNGVYDAPEAKAVRPTPWPLRSQGPMSWEEAVLRSREIDREK